jgi:hypothetical protein
MVRHLWLNANTVATTKARWPHRGVARLSDVCARAPADEAARALKREPFIYG